MTERVSVRLADKARAVLADEAKTRGIGLAAYLRELCNEEAKRLRKARIRARTKEVAEYMARDPEARAFIEDWCGGAPELPRSARRKP